ncbi:unnamed protein product, partial [Rotaria socialis]
KVLSSSLNESSIKLDKPPPKRRAISDSLSLISLDNINLNHQIDINANILNDDDDDNGVRSTDDKNHQWDTDEQQFNPPLRQL